MSIALKTEEIHRDSEHVSNLIHSWGYRGYISSVAVIPLFHQQFMNLGVRSVSHQYLSLVGLHRAPYGAP